MPDAIGGKEFKIPFNFHYLFGIQNCLYFRLVIFEMNIRSKHILLPL